jgi:hypothetical protein
MIVLLSYPGDPITNNVIDWLHLAACKYKRINLEEEDYRQLTVTINKKKSTLQFGLKDGTCLKFDDVSMFFYRGGEFRSNLDQYKLEGLPERMIKTHLSYEFNTLVHHFYNEVSKKCLGAPFSPVNKLYQLQTAAKVGLNIPETVIINSKAMLSTWLKDHQTSLISKSIQENVLLQDTGGIHYDLKVQAIEKTELPEQFFPSLFQPAIKKSIEVRTFYLDGRFYSLAMLLDAANESITDYRTCTDRIRYAKYKLPAEIESRLNKFMNKMGLNTGSIDLAFDKAGACYFLEVNPTGQIGWLSDYGNYFLEEKIARYLINKELNFIKHASLPTTC